MFWKRAEKMNGWNMFRVSGPLGYKRECLARHATSLEYVRLDQEIDIVIDISQPSRRKLSVVSRKLFSGT